MQAHTKHKSQSVLQGYVGSSMISKIQVSNAMSVSNDDETPVSTVVPKRAHNEEGSIYYVLLCVRLLISLHLAAFASCKAGKLDSSPDSVAHSNDYATAGIIVV